MSAILIHFLPGLCAGVKLFWKLPNPLAHRSINEHRSSNSEYLRVCDSTMVLKRLEIVCDANSNVSPIVDRNLG